MPWIHDLSKGLRCWLLSRCTSVLAGCLQTLLDTFEKQRHCSSDGRGYGAQETSSPSPRGNSESPQRAVVAARDPRGSGAHPDGGRSWPASSSSQAQGAGSDQAAWGRLVSRYKHPHARRCVSCGVRAYVQELPPGWEAQQIVPSTQQLIYTCSSPCRRTMGYPERSVSA